MLTVTIGPDVAPAPTKRMEEQTVGGWSTKTTSQRT